MELTDLPIFKKIPDGLRNGRSIRDGYARGWGLQFGDLKAKVAADPLYCEALALAQERTVQSEENRMNQFLLVKFYLSKLPEGHIVEFGSFRGGSAIFMAKLCAELLPKTRVYAFDTFQGMPETDASIDAHSKNDFSGVDFEELQDYVSSLKLNNLHLVRGLFEDTAPAALIKISKIRMSHIDCDIRSGVLYSYDVCKPFMVQGGYTVLDDALYSSCLGATEVVEDIMIRRDGLNSEQIYPHFVFRANETGE